MRKISTFAGIFLVLTFAFQNCGNVNLLRPTPVVESALQAPPVTPSPIPDPAPDLPPSNGVTPPEVIADACPLPAPDSGGWSNTKNICVADVEKAVDLTTGLGDTNGNNWPIEFNPFYNPTGPGCNNPQNLDVCHTHPNCCKRNPLLAEGVYHRILTGSKPGECNFMGVLSFGSYGAGAGASVFPAVNRKGSVYFAYRAVKPRNIWTLVLEQGSPNVGNVEPGGVDIVGPWYATITENPCDFSYDIVDHFKERNTNSDKVACQTHGLYPTLNFAVVDDVIKDKAAIPHAWMHKCILTTGKTYYINIRAETPVPPHRGKFIEGAPFSAPNIQLFPGNGF